MSTLRLAVALLAAPFFVAAAPNPKMSDPNMPPPANQKLAHDIFRDIVEIRSVHAVGTKQVAAVIEKYLLAGGFKPADIHVVPEKPWPHQVNLVVRHQGQGKRQAGDVDGPHGCGGCQGPRTGRCRRYKFIEKDGYFYGRGTTDMKDEDAARCRLANPAEAGALCSRPRHHRGVHRG